MTDREDRLRAAAEQVAEEIGREDVPDFIEMLLNILSWQNAQDDEERCSRYDELVRAVIANIGKDPELTKVAGYSSRGSPVALLPCHGLMYASTMR